MGMKMRRNKKRRRRILEFSDNTAHLYKKKYRPHHRELTGWIKKFDCDYKSVYVGTGDVDEDGDAEIVEKRYGIDKRKWRFNSPDNNDGWKDGE